ncbi:hypothetical protein DL93DRAFT_1863583 [Clavulina sp. PMI_390]|nr:hypothetical protein DL93DRAFT_1863583 [Clavulina sp. PMI_390]
MAPEPQKLFRGVLSPIEALPPEIIGHIVEFSVASTNVQPEDSHQVLRLSHVSATWRTITLSHSRLFDRADWTHWAPELLQRWCERAKYHSLSIRLEGEIMHALSTTIEHEQIPRQDNHSLPDMHRGTLLLKALRQAIPHAKTLDVEAYNHSRDALHVLRKLLAEEMPLMWALEIDLPDEHLGPEDAPLTIICHNLRWLSVSGVHIHSPAPISTINTLKFCNIYTDNEEMRWPTLYGNILTICPAIRELSLRFSSEGLIIGNNISLPHVQKLSILQGGYHVDTVPQVTSILNLFQLPSLEELTLETYRIPLQYYDRMLVSSNYSHRHRPNGTI